MNKHFADVPRLGGNIARALVPVGIVVQQMRILFHHGAATGRVDGNEVCAALFECCDVRARQFARRIQVASMSMQRTAARLFARLTDTEPVCLKHARSGRIGVREQAPHDATFQERYALLWPNGRMAEWHSGRMAEWPNG